MSCRRLLLVVAGLLSCAPLPAAEPTPAERGEKALLGRHFVPPNIPMTAYDNLWRAWGAKEKPENFGPALLERYGLHPAPYPNDGYPMGLRPVQGFFGKALSTDCLICHGGSIAGTSYVGLPNSTLDFQALTEDVAAVQGLPPRTPFRFSNVRGTTEAGAFAVFLMGLREPDLRLRPKRLDFGLRDDLCEDPPAWWLLKKKKTMYHTGGADARSVRSLMQFMLSPLNLPESFVREEETFRDVQAYLLSLKPPKYPLPVDGGLARAGEGLFRENCARCHGTYGDRATYPNRVVPIDEIGTDPTRLNGFRKEYVEYYNRSWFAREEAGWFADEFRSRPPTGYQAPPLDGVWATAPYFHNGSVPTVYHVLNSKARPRTYTRSFRTDLEAYDADKLGWKVRVLEKGPDETVPAFERRKVYDTTQPGRGNGGHPFGDDLSEDERRAVIEYLKTL